MLSVEEQLKLYKGDVDLLIQLKTKVLKEPLSFAEKIIATQLLDDKALQIEINSDSIDWSKYKRPPMDHQRESISFLKARLRAILADDMGLGKANESNTPILTPLGWRKIGKLKIGDKVINSQGTASRVTGVYPQGLKEAYKVYFNDKTSIVCCKEHLWSVSRPQRVWRNAPFQTLSLEKLMEEGLKYSNKNRKFCIPLVKPITFDISFAFDKIIHPYLLGAMLGDGHMKSTTFTTSDPEIASYIKRVLPLNHKIKKKKNNKYDYAITGSKKQRTNQLRNEFRRMNLFFCLSKDKFIPCEYLLSSIENRLELLRGLMDTDGDIGLNSQSKNCTSPKTTFNTTSLQLAKDVQFLVQSLGGIARFIKVHTTYKNKPYLHYRLTINMPDQFNPFRLARKARVWHPRAKYKPNRMFDKVEHIGKREMCCISIDSPDHLYVTNDCILTHNTFSSIGASLEVESTNKIIVCPKHLTPNWKREINFFTDDVVVIKDGKYKWQEAKYIILNYEKVGKYLEEIRALGVKVIIADEAHVLKNAKTLKAKTFNKLIARSKAHIWLLTGTPIANRPLDYFNLLKICRHPLTVEQGRWTPMDNSWVRFGKKFCAGKHTGYGWDFTGASNIANLHEQTKDYVLRRTKETHLDLPDKNVYPIYLELENIKDYNVVVEEAYQKRWEESRDEESNKFGTDPLAAESLVTFSIIRKFLAYEKINDGSTLGLIQDAHEEDKKVVVFTNYTAVIDRLVEELGDSCTFLDGRVRNDEEKQARVDKFQEDPKCTTIICNYKVGKMGWNLTEGRVAVMNDINWSPEANMQAQDRIYRIGQAFAVNIQYPIYGNSIERILYEIIMLKIQIIKHAVDGIPMTADPAQLTTLSQELFGSLDNRYKN